MIFDFAYGSFFLIGLLVALVILLAYRMTKVGSGTSDVIFMALVVLGAIIAPQVATVILLAMIFQQLVILTRKT